MSMYDNGEKLAPFEWTDEMDDRIKREWPEIAVFDGMYSRTVKARANYLGLRLDTKTRKKRQGSAFKQKNHLYVALEKEKRDAGVVRQIRPDAKSNPRKRHSILFTMEQDQQILDAYPDLSNLKFSDRTAKQIYQRARLLTGKTKAYHA